jgi:choice-of-anchor A domain-containing protein
MKRISLLGLMVCVAMTAAQSVSAQDGETITIISTTGVGSAFSLAPASLIQPNGFQINLPSGVNLGQAGNFSILALTGGIDDSGPLGPDANPHSVASNVGVVTSGQKFQASGSVTYGGKVFLHSGATYNNSAPGVPQPTMGAAVDSMLAQAKQDALNASAAATALGANPTATYGTINNNLSITKNSVGNFVFDITGINFSGGKILTLNAPAGSTYLLNISSQLVLTDGSILVAGGLSASDVLINYTGTSDIRFSGGGNSSEIDGTILAPNAHVALSPGVVVGSVIAGSIQMSSGANVVGVPEAPTLSLIMFGGLLAGGVGFIRRRLARCG